MKKSPKSEISKKTAAKPVAEKKPVIAKTKPAKGVAPVEKAPKPALLKTARAGATKGPVSIIVRHDVGWGNALHLRGEGPGLSWKTGAPLACVHANEWVWVAPSGGPVTFKVLLNDLTWAVGEDISVPPGRVLTITPEF